MDKQLTAVIEAAKELNYACDKMWNTFKITSNIPEHIAKPICQAQQKLFNVLESLSNQKEERSSIEKENDELDAETIKAIEDMADNDFAAMEAMDFAEWLKENKMSPDGFGGWVGEINTNLHGSKTEQLFDLFKRQQHQEFKKKVEQRKNKNHETD